MYTMVLMMAATTGGDVAAFGGRSSCHGGSGCTGTVMTAPVSSCTGNVASSCHGSSSSCHGGGLFGLRSGGGLFGKKGGSCHGSSSCMGSTVSGSCMGSTMSGSCHGGGCYGSAPVMVGGCVPTVGTVGGPVMTPPVSMPKDPAKPMDPVKPTTDPAKPPVDPTKKQD